MATSPTQVEKYLGGVDYPCSKTDLVNHARDAGADQNVISTLQNLPYDEFNSPSDVSEAVGQEM